MSQTERENNLKDIHSFMDKSGINGILANFPGDHGDHDNEVLYNSYECNGQMKPSMVISVENQSANDASNSRIPVSEDKGHNHVIRIEYTDNGGEMDVYYDLSADYENQVSVKYWETDKPLRQYEQQNNIYAGTQRQDGYKDYGSVTDIDEAVGRMNEYLNFHQDEIVASIKVSDFGRYASDSPKFAEAMKEAEGYEQSWQDRCNAHQAKTDVIKQEHEESRLVREQKAAQREQKFNEFFGNIKSYMTGSDKEYN